MKTCKKLSLMALIVSTVLFSFLLTGCQKNDAAGAAQSKKEYEKGILTETSFESEYLNLKFTAPEDYIMATDEDLVSLLDFGAEIVYKDADKKILDYTKANVVFEMMVSSPNGVPNMSLMVEKLSLSNMTEVQYLENLKTGLQSNETANYTIPDTTTTVELAGESYTQLTVTAESMGIEMIQDYLIRKSDDRIVGIIFTYTEDTRAEMEELVGALTVR